MLRGYFFSNIVKRRMIKRAYINLHCLDKLPENYTLSIKKKELEDKREHFCKRFKSRDKRVSRYLKTRYLEILTVIYIKTTNKTSKVETLDLNSLLKKKTVFKVKIEKFEEKKERVKIEL